MSYGSANVPLDPLWQSVTQVGARSRLWTSIARLLQAAWIWWLAVLLVLCIDAVQPIAPQGRLALSLILLAAIPVLLWRARPRREHSARRVLRDAREIEIHHQLDANELVSGLMLAPLARQPHDVLVGELARRTTERGRSTLRRIDRDAIIDRTPARRHGIGLLLVIAAWAACAWLVPHLIVGGAARLAAPTGDTPPFSFTRIEASADAQVGRRDGDVVVTAELSGRLAPAAELVEFDDAGNEIRRWPMRQVNADTFTFTLLSLGEPMTVRIDAGDGQSRPLRLTPHSAPRPSAAAAQVADAESSASASASAQDTDDAANHIGPAPGFDPADSGMLADRARSHDPDRAGGDPAATLRRPGIRRETAATMDDPGDSSDAIMQQAPPQYRPLIRQYFERLAADQQEPQP